MPRRLQTNRVLVVEDDDLQAKAYSIALARAGLQVLAVSSLARARAAVREESFDLVILDFDLPDGTSHQFLSEHLTLSCPTIVASSRPPGDLLGRLQGLPVDLVVQKSELRGGGIVDAREAAQRAYRMR